MGYLDAGKTGALSALDRAIAAYAPVTGLGSKYGAAGDTYMDALGLNGAAGNTRATGTFQSSPGYEFKVNSALDANDRRAASRGMLGSGNTSLDTLSTVHGLADQDYSAWLGNLSGLTSLGAGLTTTGAGGVASGEMAKSPVYTNDANARVGLASGVTTGINSQATQAANAEMAGSGNLWNFGLNLAKLGTGFLGGGTGQMPLGNVGGGVLGNFQPGQR